MGPPRVLLSDRGSNFLSAIVTSLCDLLKVTRAATTAYHPQTNGRIERFWGTLKSMLAMYVSEDRDNWDEVLGIVTYAYNSSPRTSTGFSPCELLFGISPRLPIDQMLIPGQAELANSPELLQGLAAKLRLIRRLAQQHSDKRHAGQKKGRDKVFRAPKFCEGDWVLRRIEVIHGPGRKLAPKWDGPHQVVYAPLQPTTVILKLSASCGGGGT